MPYYVNLNIELFDPDYERFLQVFAVDPYEEVPSSAQIESDFLSVLWDRLAGGQYEKLRNALLRDMGEWQHAWTVESIFFIPP